ncbi:MAG: hypothetical protein VW982_01465 [Candidatus Poseidoniales archaeon]|jgi:ADP-ribosylglycohydrolase
MTMMSWRPPGYRFQARDLVKGLCSDETDQAMLLMAAIHGKVELFADAKAWNGFLWLVMSTCKVDGKPLYTGMELGALKASLPIVWL